jgi:hypothetical protein
VLHIYLNIWYDGTRNFWRELNKAFTTSSIYIALDAQKNGDVDDVEEKRWDEGRPVETCVDVDDYVPLPLACTQGRVDDYSNPGHARRKEEENGRKWGAACSRARPTKRGRCDGVAVRLSVPLASQSELRATDAHSLHVRICFFSHGVNVRVACRAYLYLHGDTWVWYFLLVTSAIAPRAKEVLSPRHRLSHSARVCNLSICQHKKETWAAERRTPPYLITQTTACSPVDRAATWIN